ncbi:MAG: hypothetical protein I8H71_00830 [Xanthomonadaceae bacterium]|nr:hypothetical protein [Xanthomonadaceae bacterium]
MTDENGGTSTTKVAIAWLVEGTETPVGHGNNAPVRCVVRLEDGTLSAAILKRLDQPALTIEVFCALVLRGWGLHVPRPLIVQIENEGLAFGSADEGFPDLKQQLNFDDELPAEIRHELRVRAAALVSSFTQTPLAIAADEAIANRDRHLANILWDGTTVAWIDHEGALGNSAEPDQNRLVALVCLLGDYESMRDKALQAATLLPKAPASAFPMDLPAGFLDGIEVSRALVSGLTALTQRVLLRFPQPADLFHLPKE